MDWFKRKDKQYFSYDHDIHSHILPGLDDGVKRVEDSVVIVKKMLELGVKQFSWKAERSERTFIKRGNRDRGGCRGGIQDR